MKLGKGLLTKDLIGIASYTIAEPFIDGLVSKFGVGIPEDLIMVALGYFLRGRKGIIGSIGNAMFAINLYTLIRGFVSGSGLLGAGALGSGW